MKKGGIMDKEEKLIPGTDPKHHQKLPDGWDNSAVDTGGKRANTYNDWAFDEKNDDKEEGVSETTMESLNEARELAEFARDNVIIYTGFFVDQEELLEHNKHETLDRVIKDPHVTIEFRPNSLPLISGIVDNLDPGEPGSEAIIKAVGYANDGKNQGYLVDIQTENTPVENYIKQKTVTMENGESRPAQAHITVSVSEDGKPVDTEKLNFEPLPEEEQFELTGRLGIFSKDGIIYDRKVIEEMKESQDNQ